MKKVYPVIFTRVNDAFLVEVPDMDIVTEGKDMADAIDMARDAIGIKGITMEDLGQEIPEPSEMGAVDVAKGEFAGEGTGCLSMVDIDFAEYRRQVDTKPVRRNVSLPSWLDAKAEKAHINVSRVLQDALIEKLGVQK